MKKTGFLTAATLATFVASAAPAGAAFLTFQGNATQEAAWRIAAGTTFIETFDGLPQGFNVSSLPALGVSFDPLAPGRFPAVYIHNVNNTPSLPHQLGNMPSGFPNEPAFQFSDIEMRVLPGQVITAVGYWNGDPQGPMVATVFDALDNLLGSVSAAINTGGGNTFAGFVSDVPIARVHFEGLTGDGFNHIDDLQTNTTAASIPEPVSLALFGLGLAGLGIARRRRMR